MLSESSETKRSADIISQDFYGKRFFKLFWLVYFTGSPALYFQAFEAEWPGVLQRPAITLNPSI